MKPTLASFFLHALAEAPRWGDLTDDEREALRTPADFDRLVREAREAAVSGSDDLRMAEALQRSKDAASYRLDEDAETAADILETVRRLGFRDVDHTWEGVLNVVSLEDMAVVKGWDLDGAALTLASEVWENA